MAVHDSETIENVKPALAAGKYFVHSSTELSYEFGAASDIGRHRKENQDHFIVLRRTRTQQLLHTNVPTEQLTLPTDETFAMAVADGMGGHGCGALASEIAIRTAWDLAGRTIGWVMKFPSGTIATCNTTYGANQEGFTLLHGSKGTLEIFGYGYDGIHMTVKSKQQVEQPQPDTNKDPHQFVVESDYFSRCVLDNKEPGPNGEEGLRDMQAIARIYAAAKKA